MRVAEAEFAFRMEQALPARDAAYEMAEVLEAVGSLHPADRDSRFALRRLRRRRRAAADRRLRLCLLVGRGACRGRCLARARPGRARGRAFLNGDAAADGIGANVLGDPRIALTWLANELMTYDSGLRAGDWVTTGTCIVPVAIAPGDVVRAEFGVLGDVTVRLASS